MVNKLSILKISDQFSDEISVITADTDYIYVAAGNIIYLCEFGKILHRFTGHATHVSLILPFSNHILSVGEDNILLVWDRTSLEQYCSLTFSASTFSITCLLHPSTYINKILIGSVQGKLQLWNVRSRSLVYSFKGWDSAVTVLEHSPAIDVVAIGLADGRIILHNLKFDETVLQFHQEWGPVSGLSFRSDGPTLLVSASLVGHLAVWDLSARKIFCQQLNAHNAAVTGLYCLPEEPIMVTTSPDNSIKVWIFDQTDGSPRQYMSRSGHSSPPSAIRFHGNDGRAILSAAQDSTFRLFSTVHQRLDKSMGRASYNKKVSKRLGSKRDTHVMPHITAFASEVSKQSDWDGVVCCHQGVSMVTTWNLHRSTMGSHKLKHKRFDSAPFLDSSALCVDISGCGNFCIIGFSSGHIDVFNMQSGLYRGSFSNGDVDKCAHSGAVRGVCFDAALARVISGGADGLLSFWRFKNKTLIDSNVFTVPINKLVLHRDSSMLAVATDDFEVHIVDIDTMNVIRHFVGHESTITDMTFSSDARWLVTACMDSAIRTWHLPVGRLIDRFYTERAPTSISFSASGDFLATTHTDDIGVYLWCNRAQYSHVPLKPIPEFVETEDESDVYRHFVRLPSTREQTAGDLPVDEEETNGDADMLAEYVSPAQLSSDLITLSQLPTSKWFNLLFLDTIRQRNKPKQPPKVPKSAPFFLPTTSGLEPTFVKEPAADSTKKKSADVANVVALLDHGTFRDLLTSPTNDQASPFEFLKELGPSGIDLAIRSLSPDAGGSVSVLSSFLRAVKRALSCGRDFELIQSYLALFLKIHGEIITATPELTDALSQVLEIQERSWKQLSDLMSKSSCIITFLKSATL